MSGNTNPFRLFYQSLVLFAFYGFGLGQELQYELSIQSFFFNDSDENWGPTVISKFADEDRFAFTSIELTLLFGHREFYPYNVEILGLVDRMVRFSLLQRGADLQWFVNVIFSSNEDIQKFFRDTRAQQEQQWVETLEIKKMFQYSSDTSQNGVPTLIPLSHDGAFFVKKLEPYWFDNPKSFNFVRIDERGAKEADLVIESMKFNISTRIGDTTYVLCSNIIQYSYFAHVILFPDKTTADKFFDCVKDEVNGQIACSSDWLTPELIQQINSPIMPDLTHLPYLRNE